MKITDCTIKIIINIDENIHTLATCIHYWNTNCPIEYPFIYSTRRRITIDVNIICCCNKETPWSCQTTRDSSCWYNTLFGPNDNATILSISYKDRVVCIDKNIVRLWTDCADICKSCSIWIPWCIWTEFWLIIRQS